MAGLKSCMMVFMMMMMMHMHTSMAQTRHVVGGALGWTIPPNGAGAYTTWAAGQTFTVGDNLFFNFTTGLHNVAQVTQAAYGPCSTANPISLTTAGPATVTLTTAGAHYYICTVGTHCSIGQKLNITVVAAAATPPPAAAPTTPPPAATPTTPPPAATPTTSPPAATPAPTPTPTPAATPTSSPAPAPVDQATPPSPPTPGPSPSGSTTSPPPGATETPTGSATPAPPSNAGASFTAVVPATFLAIGLAMFY